MDVTLLRINSVLDSAQLGIWDWYIQSGQVVFNDMWKKMLGYEPTELENTIETWKKLIHPNDIDETYRILNNHLYGNTEHYTSEHRLLHKNGDYIWILDTGKVVERDINGKPYRATGIHQNITERKKLEIDLKTSNEAKTVFLASMSHELKIC